MKKTIKTAILGITTAAVFSMMFAGCSSTSSTSSPQQSASQESSAATQETKVYNVGYSNMQVKEDFFITVESGIAQAAKEAGYEYNTTISDRDATKMKQNIEGLVTKGADIIIDFNVMAEAGSAIAADLSKENIPMLSVDCLYDGAYFFGVNNLDAGKILGEAAIPFVEEKFGGSIDYVVNLYDANSGDEVKKRNDGVVVSLQEKYGLSDDQIVWLDSKADDVKTQTMTKDWLNSHPEAKKVVFVGQNDDRGYAINVAVEAENRAADAIIVSHNADPAAIENLEKNVDSKASAWVATASYNSHLYGQQIIDMATRILNGDKVENSEYTKVTVVTTDNVVDYVAQRDEVIASMNNK